MAPDGPSVARPDGSTPSDEAEPTDQGYRLSAGEAVLSLVTLFTVSVAQPLLDLLGRNAEFLVAHDAGRLDVIAIGIGLTLVAPLVAGALVLLVRTVNRDAGQALHSVMLAGLVGVLVLVVLRLTGIGERGPGWLWLAVATLIGVAATVAYRRSTVLRRATSFAAVTAPLVAAMFLFASPAAGLVFQGDDVEMRASGQGDLPPIVFVMFDEWPTASLLDSGDELDTRFPTFNRLLRHGTFFPNTTTVHPTTTDAVPASLSGRFSDPQALPTGSDHPTNLLALLGDYYRVRAVEPLTDLCPRDRCKGRRRQATESTNEGLVRDLGVVGLHLVLPDDLTDGLPSIHDSWRDFETVGSAAEEPPAELDLRTPPTPGRSAKALTPRQKRQALLKGQGKPRLANRPRIIRDFISDIRASHRPTLHFLHTVFPHRPWRHLPDSTLHLASDREPALGEHEVWTTREWPVAQAYQLHLVQTQTADTLVGELIQRLRDQRMYHDALIVLTADHGASFAPGTPLRALNDDTFGEIGYVPLFIKAPGQREGGIVDTPVQTIDILPTILDILGVESPVELDGHSAFDENAPQLRERVVFDIDGSRHEFPVGPQPLRQAVDRKVALFGRGTEQDDFYGLAPEGTARLLGQAVPDDPGSDAGMPVELASPDAYDDVDLASGQIPAQVSGRINGTDPDDPPVIAVALNGTIAAVTRADLGNGPAGGFRALVPPDALQQGRNDVQILLVGPDNELTSLPIT